MKNIIVSFPGFSIGDFLKDKKSEDWQIIASADFAQKGFRGILRFVRAEKYDNFIIGRQNLSEQEVRIFLEGILFLARAKNKNLVDNFGRKEKLNYPKFFWDLTKFSVELVFDLFVIIFTYLLVFSFVIISKIPYKVSRNKDNKKIVFLRTDFFGTQRTGGSFSHANGFISGAKDLGWEVIGVAQERFFDGGIKFYKIPYVTFHNSPEIPEVLYNYKFIWNALPIIKKEKPAFLYQRHSFMNISGAVLARIFKIPFILEYNGSEAWIREKWGGKLFLRHLAYYLEDLALKSAYGISVVSEALVEELQKRGVKNERIIMNPNGVDLDHFHPDLNGSEIREKYKFNNEEIVAGFLGTFGAWHGVEVLTASIKKVVARNPKIRFLIIGDGNLKPLVEKMIHDDKVEDYVVLAGLVPHDVVPGYLAACDILVSPHIPNKDGSKFFGSPTKIFEYMAMGKGIVASNLDQIGKVLEHQRTAWLVKPGDVDDLANGILGLAEDKHFREELAANAVMEVSSKYTWTKNAERVIDHYLAV